MSAYISRWTNQIGHVAGNAIKETKPKKEVSVIIKQYEKEKRQEKQQE